MGRMWCQQCVCGCVCWPAADFSTASWRTARWCWPSVEEPFPLLPPPPPPQPRPASQTCWLPLEGRRPKVCRAATLEWSGQESSTSKNKKLWWGSGYDDLVEKRAETRTFFLTVTLVEEQFPEFSVKLKSLTCGDTGPPSEQPAGRSSGLLAGCTTGPGTNLKSHSRSESGQTNSDVEPRRLTWTGNGGGGISHGVVCNPKFSRFSHSLSQFPERWRRAKADEAAGIKLKLGYKTASTASRHPSFAKIQVQFLFFFFFLSGHANRCDEAGTRRESDHLCAFTPAVYLNVSPTTGRTGSEMLQVPWQTGLSSRTSAYSHRM